MKVWKVLNNKDYGVACYVKISKDIFDSSWYALQLAREKIDKNLCSTQLLDIDHDEKIINNIPILKLEYKEVK